MHCNSQTAYFLSFSFFSCRRSACKFVVFSNEKPIALPLIQNSPSINYINCTLTASRFSDDFPTISCSFPTSSCLVALFYSPPLADSMQFPNVCTSHLLPVFQYTSLSFSLSLAVSVCLSVSFSLSSTLVLLCIAPMLLSSFIVDVVYLGERVSRAIARRVHFLETNFGVSVLKLFPYVMI